MSKREMGERERERESDREREKKKERGRERHTYVRGSRNNKTALQSPLINPPHNRQPEAQATASVKAINCGEKTKGWFDWQCIVVNEIRIAR
jgi:hypothetical protein